MDENQGRIARAVLDGMVMSHGDGTATMNWNDKEYVLVCGDNYGVGAYGNLGHGLYWWNTRQGQPWQHDLETDVEAWLAKYAHVPDDDLDRYLAGERLAAFWTWASERRVPNA